MPLLKDAAAKIDRDLFWHDPHYHAGGDGPYSAIRSGDWRLIEFHETGGAELYNLNSDIREQHNLAGQDPEHTAKLRERLESWRTQIKAQMPTDNPNYDPARATQVGRNVRRK